MNPAQNSCSLATKGASPDSPDESAVEWLVDGGIASPAGFLAAGVHCGIKRVKLDLAVVAAEAPVPAAGMFTTNRVQAAPVLYCKQALAGGMARAIVVNSGNANACTGSQGLENAREMAQLVADALGSRLEEVLVCSTGVIGQQLPMAALRSGIPSAVAGLARTHESAAAAAQAILTTDTSAKACACRVELSGGAVIVGGIAKGSGMIAPDLELAPHATTLAFLTTDAVLDSQALGESLERAIADSFNAITVDSDTSTNDTVLLLASGASGVPARGAAGQERLLAAVLVALEVARGLAEGRLRQVVGILLQAQARPQAPGDRERRARAPHESTRGVVPETALAVHSGARAG